MRNAPKASVRNSLLLWIALILVSGFMALSLINYRVSRDAIRQDLVASGLPMMRDTIYSEIQVDLVRPVFVSSLMANDTFLKDWVRDGEKDLDKISRYLLEIKNKYDFFSSFFVSAKTSKYYHFSGLLKTMDREDSHDIWFYSFLDSAKESRLDIDTDQASKNALTIFINHRVHGNAGELLGVTGVGLNLDSVARLLDGYSRKYGRNIFLVDTKGVVQVHGATHGVAQNWAPGNVSFESILDNRNVPHDYNFERGGDTILATVRYISELNWFLVVEQNESAVLADARATLLRTILIGFCVSCLVVWLVWKAVRRYQERLVLLATTDELTGAMNRREFERLYDLAQYSMNRNKETFSLLLIDLDGFKAVNDTMGHLEGDRLLQAFAVLAAKHIRRLDALIRWGGDEFVILCQTGTEQAAQLAERLRMAVELSPEINPPNRVKIVVTLSVGVVVVQADESLDVLTARADKALYAAKSSGRNRVVTVPA